VLRCGDVRRAKLYYLRGLTGKKARIKERSNYTLPKTGTASKKDAPKADAKSAAAKPAEVKAETPKKEEAKADAPKKEEAKADKPKKEEAVKAAAPKKEEAAGTPKEESPKKEA